MQKASLKVTIRNLTLEDVPKIIELQKESFPYMANEGMIWKENSLKSHGTLLSGLTFFVLS
ncbi:MAG: hypothetical protein KGI27_10175 [Thaumarchaeota archaeon]|nr:hypothetical protein [Nitrososphaerota archaeon]